jgi:hypothetical protein
MNFIKLSQYGLISFNMLITTLKPPRCQHLRCDSQRPQVEISPGRTRISKKSLRSFFFKKAPFNKKKDQLKSRSITNVVKYLLKKDKISNKAMLSVISLRYHSL